MYGTVPHDVRGLCSAGRIDVLRGGESPNHLHPPRMQSAWTPDSPFSNLRIEHFEDLWIGTKR